MTGKVTLTFRDRASYEGLLRTVARKKKMTVFRLEEILKAHDGLTIDEEKSAPEDTLLQKLVTDQMNVVYFGKGLIDHTKFSQFSHDQIHAAARKYFLHLLDNNYQMFFHDYPPEQNRSVQLAVDRAICAYVPFNEFGLHFLERKADPEVAKKLLTKVEQSIYTNAKMAYRAFTVLAWFHVQGMPQFPKFKDKIIKEGHERDADVLQYVNGELKRDVLERARQLHHL